MVNVFSYCLFGPRNPRYYGPLLRNVSLIARHFPDWKVYIYIAPDVEPAYVNALREGPNVVLRPTHVHGPINTLHRFFAIDEPEVDLMMVRDADSLVSWKDRWAIQQFLTKPDCVAHAIRDHRDHRARLLAGLWGLRKGILNMQEQVISFLTDPSSEDFGFPADQNFLSGCVYPNIKDRLWVHYSFDSLLAPTEQGERFPFAWSEANFCGKVEQCSP